MENFERRYYVNEHGLYAVDTWAVNGQPCESRTTDIDPDDVQDDRDQIAAAFALFEAGL